MAEPSWLAVPEGLNLFTGIAALERPDQPSLDHNPVVCHRHAQNADTAMDDVTDRRSDCLEPHVGTGASILRLSSVRNPCH